MKRLNLQTTTVFLSLVVMYSCGPSKKSETAESAESTPAKKYTLTKAPPSYDYPEAGLELISSTDDLDTGDVTFEFAVTNYELAVQTPDAETRGIANSGKGQHIHFILNNDPYSAHYESSFTKNLSEGNHVVLAFLSRSYHESVKNGMAYVLKEITVGEPEATGNFDETAQHLFYSRPKGTYSGADTEKLMLDFFLFNTEISPEGNKVRATINGEENYLTEWAPYYIEGLEKGEVNVKLELLDKDGNLIPGPFNSVERKVILE